MAAGSLLALLDDIASVMDDVAMMTKVAGKKTAGVLGDDIALNAQQVGGVMSDRELPIVWAVAKGSLRNKLILVPAALAISAVFPAAITPLLILGGLYLSFEGAEKVLHNLFHPKDAAHLESDTRTEEPVDGGSTGADSTVAGSTDMGSVDVTSAEGAPAALRDAHVEKEKIQGAIRTDFILSAEIIAIALGTVAMADFLTQALVVSVIALVMTVGVYGFVAGVVRMDDFGLALSCRENSVFRRIGRGILAGAPYLMKGLSIVGTAAMFLVGGGILVHGTPRLEHLLREWTPTEPAHAGLMEAILGGLTPILFNAAVGAVAGLIVVGLVTLARRLKNGMRAGSSPH
ncbi:MAG TPA: DUF808 domain-containing protein [Burkholderiaceae bacterium]|nr:DUF808 domain-containing protein [Burkholderiaceae bacterium]